MDLLLRLIVEKYADDCLSPVFHIQSSPSVRHWRVSSWKKLWVIQALNTHQRDNLHLLMDAQLLSHLLHNLQEFGCRMDPLMETRAAVRAWFFLSELIKVLTAKTLLRSTIFIPDNDPLFPEFVWLCRCPDLVVLENIVPTSGLKYIAGFALISRSILTVANDKWQWLAVIYEVFVIGKKIENSTELWNRSTRLDRCTARAATNAGVSVT